MYKCVFKTLYYKNSLYFNDYFPFVTWNAGRPKVKHCSGLWIQLIFENKLKLLIIVSLTSNFVRTILITSILWNMVDNRSREMLKAQENTISGGKFLTDCRVIKIHAIYMYMAAPSGAFWPPITLLGRSPMENWVDEKSTFLIADF